MKDKMSGLMLRKFLIAEIRFSAKFYRCFLLQKIEKKSLFN